jgi:very-short-patch-repair endonuclease
VWNHFKSPPWQGGWGMYVNMKMNLDYNPKLKKLARELRSKSTLAEVLLWNQIKAGKMKGYDFLRQKPIDEYIFDFYCPQLKLVIEIDGSSHFRDNKKKEFDLLRQQKLESLGLYVIRFYDIDVKTTMQGVYLKIQEWMENQTSS